MAPGPARGRQGPPDVLVVMAAGERAPGAADPAGGGTARPAGLVGPSAGPSGQPGLAGPGQPGPGAGGTGGARPVGFERCLLMPAGAHTLSVSDPTPVRLRLCHGAGLS